MVGNTPISRREFFGGSAASAAASVLAEADKPNQLTDAEKVMAETLKQQAAELGKQTEKLVKEHANWYALTAWKSLNELHSHPDGTIIEYYHHSGHTGCETIINKVKSWVELLEKVIAAADGKLADDHLVPFDKTQLTKTPTLGEIKTKLQEWGNADTIVSNATKAAGTAISNYDTTKAWMEKLAVGYKPPVDYTEDDEDNNPASIFHSMASSHPSAFGSPEVTRALALPDDSGEKYTTLDTQFALFEGRTHIFKPEAVMSRAILVLASSNSGDAAAQTHHQPARIALSPTEDHPPETGAPDIIGNLRKALGTHLVRYNPHHKLYETDLRATPDNLASLRILLGDDPAALGGLAKMHTGSDPENHQGMVYPHDSGPASFSGTVCFYENAARHLASQAEKIAAARALNSSARAR